jgi:hypothetical protein
MHIASDNVRCNQWRQRLPNFRQAFRQWCQLKAVNGVRRRNDALRNIYLDSLKLTPLSVQASF